MPYNKVMKKVFGIFKTKKKFLILIIIIFGTRMFHGNFYINNPFGYPSSRVRLFTIKVNNNMMPDVSYKLSSRIPIIPFFLYIESSTEGTSKYNDKLVSGYFKITDDNIKIKLNTYECNNKYSQTKCKFYDKKNVTKKKYKIRNMIIFRISNPRKELYNGKPIEDISEYLAEKGVYNITLKGKYNMTKFQINFYIKKV